MTLRDIAHATAMKWMPDKEPDSMQVIALMCHIEGAIKTAIALENEACAKIAHAEVSMDDSGHHVAKLIERLIRARGTR